MEHGNSTGSETQAIIRQDLCRLARFGANISDAHSCFIFLPSLLFAQPGDNTYTTPRFVEVAGYHTLSNSINPACKLSSDSGLIGWVAKHGRSIHVSPFEHDSRTLGVYTVDQELKSFIGIPVPLPFLDSQKSSKTASLSGVVACDSKKSFAFSKLQGKLLEDLSQEVSHTVKLLLAAVRPEETFGRSYREFLIRGEELTVALGMGSVEVLRIRPTNFDIAERALGAGRSIELLDQTYRLIQQAIPPHLPSLRLPQGDLVFIVDNMMTSVYENKIRALLPRIAIDSISLALTFSRQSFKNHPMMKKRGSGVSLEQLITETNEVIGGEAPQGKVDRRSTERGLFERGFAYEYRRA